MAVLTASQLQKARNLCEKGNLSDTLLMNYTKAQINAGIQAIEDTFEANRTTISSAIDTATSPLVLTPGQKRHLVRSWLNHKFEVE